MVENKEVYKEFDHLIFKEKPQLALFRDYMEKEKYNSARWMVEDQLEIALKQITIEITDDKVEMNELLKTVTEYRM